MTERPARDSTTEAQPDFDISSHLLAPNKTGPSPKEVDTLFPPVDVVRMQWWVGPRLILLALFLVFVFPILVNAVLGKTLAVVLWIPALLFAAYITPAAVRQTVAGLADIGFFWSLYGWSARGDEPWLVDHAWGDLGETRGAFGRIWALYRKVTLGGLVIAAAIVAVSSWLAWIPLAIIATIVLVRGFLSATSGASRITYLERPYRVGQPVTVRFGLGDGATIFWKARYLLACYEERAYPAGSDSPFGFARRELYREVARVPADHVPEAGSDIDIPFSPPEHLKPTCLRQRQRTYWEFRVIAETESGPFDERFMVPVY
jgi:hypothetical protein